MAAFLLSAFADEADAMLKGQIEALRQNGIGQIELRGVNGKSVAALTDAEAASVRLLMDDAGISISSMGSPYGNYPINEPLDRHIDDFRRGLDICRALGAARIRMFSFFMPEGEDPADYRARVLDGIGQMLDLADKAGIRLAHENEKGIYGDVAARCVDLMEIFGDRMGFIFDPANFIQCGVKPKEAFPLLSRWIEYLHIKDAQLDGGAVVPAGMGDGEIQWILDQLAGRQADVTLTIEPHLTVFEGLNALQSESLTHRFHYPDKRTAFDAAADALKSVMASLGFSEIKGGLGRWIR